MLRSLIIYSALQTVISIVILKLTDFTAPLIIALWTVSLLSAIMYFATYIKDPGYIDTFKSIGRIEQPKDIDIENQLPESKRNLGEQQIPKIIVMKQRQCIICHSMQPIRTKHCHQCNRCVMTFDHHCPLMGTCIGQKNRALFYCYLVLEVAGLILTVIVLRNCQKEWQEHYRLGLLFAVVLVFTILASILLLFHTYLMFKGITTWEYFSWHNITYLSNMPDLVNPFSKSISTNLKTYWTLGCRKEPYLWTAC